MSPIFGIGLSHDGFTDGCAVSSLRDVKVEPGSRARGDEQSLVRLGPAVVPTFLAALRELWKRRDEGRAVDRQGKVVQ